MSKMYDSDRGGRYYWYLAIDDDVTGVDFREVANIIVNTLSDVYGWSRYGYHFKMIENMNNDNSKKNKKNVIAVRISSPKTLKRQCNFEGLSCTDLQRNEILFNSHRWKYGSKKSGLCLNHYRQQLINHEFGHAIGYDHVVPEVNQNRECPVMYQQTISDGRCKPNIYPVDRDYNAQRL